MTKRAQKGSGEERVTAKSRPMMNLVARAPSHVSSSTSVSPGKKLWKSKSLEYNCWERGKTGATWYRHRPIESFWLLISWKTCAPPRTRGVTTLTTSTLPSQVMSPTTWPLASSTTLQVPSPTLHRHRTRTWMTWHSASCSPRHTEDKPITAIQKACQSVSRLCLLCLIEQGNLWEKEMSTSQLFSVSQETRRLRLPHRSDEAQKSSPQNRLEARPKRCLLDPSWEGPWEGIPFWQTKSHAIITYSTAPPVCIESVISRLGEMTIYQRSLTSRLARRVVLKGTWVCWGVAGNCNGTLSEASFPNNAAREKKTRFKSISDFMEFHKTSSTKTKSGWPRCKNWLIDCKMDIATSPSSKTWNKKAYSMCSARNQSASWKCLIPSQ